MTGNRRMYWAPTRAYGLVDAVNRHGLATGSMRSAALGAHADYNGHRVEVDPPNAARRYWVAGYTWAGWNVIGRGGLRECLEAALREHGRGALGSEVLVEVTSDEDAALCESMGLAPYSDEARRAHDAAWRTPLHDEVPHAFTMQDQLGCPAVGLLANSRTLEEYKAKVDAHFADRRAARQGAGAARG